MEETAADKTAKRSERRERPENLKDQGRRQGETEHEHYHDAAVRGIPTANGLREHDDQRQQLHALQREHQVPLPRGEPDGEQRGGLPLRILRRLLSAAVENEPVQTKFFRPACKVF